MNLGPRSLTSSSMELMETEMRMGLYRKRRLWNGPTTCLCLLTVVLLMTSAVSLTLLVLQIHGTIDLALTHRADDKQKQMPETSSSLMNVKDYEDYASTHMNADIWTIIRRGAMSETTLHDNLKTFKRYRLMPRHLVPVNGFNSSTTILGHAVTMPIGVSPMTWQGMVHPEAENATAMAVQALGTVVALSFHSYVEWDEAAEVAPRSLRWQQMHIYDDRAFTLEVIRQAEAAGSKALVVTIDKPVKTIWYPSSTSSLSQTLWKTYGPKCNNLSRVSEAAELTRSEQSWEKLAWVRNQTALPIVLKGIINAEDVPIAELYGANAILVSNHGGRALDGLPATIDALPSIVQAARNTSLEIYLDGGIRSGTDVFRALALGARAVFVGRPVMWGLGYSGQTGVQNVLTILQKEFINTAQFCGCQGMDDINESMILVPDSAVKFHRGSARLPQHLSSVWAGNAN